MTATTETTSGLEPRTASTLPVPMGNDEMADYKLTVGVQDQLTLEQEVALAKRIEAGLYAGHLLGQGRVAEDERWLYETVVAEGETAFDDLILANARIAYYEAQKVMGRRETRVFSYVTLVQEGIRGLVRAAEKFDFMRGLPLAAIAFREANMVMSRALYTGEYGPHISHDAALVVSMVLGARGRLCEQGSEPTAVQILEAVNDWKRQYAARKGVPPSKLLEIDDVLMALEHVSPVASLDLDLGDEKDSNSLGSIVVDWEEADRDGVFEAAFDGVRRSRIMAALQSVLNARQVRVVDLTYGLSDGVARSRSEVGSLLEPPASGQAVGQVLARVLPRLRESEVADQLAAYYHED